MTNVFIGGSRAVSRLDLAIREKLDDLMRRECRILVGDANGADKAVQQHFADRGYRNVTIYCMDRCRNNIGRWETKALRMTGAKRDFAYYASKDLATARDAKCGVMLWDGISKGTLNNIQNLIGCGKKTLVYFAPAKDFVKLVNECDLREYLQRCDPVKLEEAQRQLNRKTRPSEAQLALTSQA